MPGSNKLSAFYFIFYIASSLVLVSSAAQAASHGDTVSRSAPTARKIIFDGDYYAEGLYLALQAEAGKGQVKRIPGGFSLTDSEDPRTFVSCKTKKGEAGKYYCNFSLATATEEAGGEFHSAKFSEALYDGLSSVHVQHPDFQNLLIQDGRVIFTGPHNTLFQPTLDLTKAGGASKGRMSLVFIQPPTPPGSAGK